MKNELFFSLLPIKTDRLIIRKTSINDINLIMKMDKQEITQMFLGGIKNKTREERIRFLEKKNNSLTVYLKNNKSIGFIDLKIDKENKQCELSYIFDYDYSKLGHCTEACKKLINIVFNILDIDTIYALTICDNISSKRVLEN